MEHSQTPHELTHNQPTPYRAIRLVAQQSRGGRILHLGGKPGSGRTTVLRRLASELRAPIIDMKDLLPVVTSSHPLAIEEAMTNLIIEALKTKDCVIVDDFGLLC